MKLYIVYRTDAWLSCASREFCGVFESAESAIKSIVRKAPLRSKYARSQLEEDWQTQDRDENYQIEEISLNEWVG